MNGCFAWEEKKKLAPDEHSFCLSDHTFVKSSIVINNNTKVMSLDIINCSLIWSIFGLCTCIVCFFSCKHHSSISRFIMVNRVGKENGNASNLFCQDIHAFVLLLFIHLYMCFLSAIDQVTSLNDYLWYSSFERNMPTHLLHVNDSMTKTSWAWFSYVTGQIQSI